MKKIQENKGVIINYFVEGAKYPVAKCYREDVSEAIKWIEAMRDFDTEVAFRGEEDLNDYIPDITEEDRVEIGKAVYRVFDYVVYLGTEVSLFVIEVYLEER